MDNSVNNVDEIVADMVRTVVREVQPEKIILFGSRARGKADRDSDVDLLVIEKEPFGPSRSRHQELTRIRKALSRFPIAKDILLFSEQEEQQWANSPYHVLAHGLREGKILYARS